MSDYEVGKESANDLPVEYIPGNSVDFVLFIKKLEDKAQLGHIDTPEGKKFRWVITREDGSKYIARPQDAN